MKTIIACLMLSIVPMSAFGDDLTIGSIDNGSVTWSDAYSNGYYQVQWAASLTGVWQSTWAQLSSIRATGQGDRSMPVPMFYRITYRPSITNDLCLVPAGGQPQGPNYDFWMSRYETSNEEFAQFLNDAQANTNNSRGQYMTFFNTGNIGLGTGSATNTPLFRIDNSRLIYDPGQPVGHRYSVYPDYIGHPITGVSWYGALKYCNWLTIHSGRLDSDRCYSEGNASTNWKPTHLTWGEWDDGLSDVERLQWLSYRGFRLPMNHYDSNPNYYNEHYKAAAWTGSSNILYGFGRNTINQQDANYSSSGDPYEAFAVKTAPCGYYDGSNHGGAFTTRSNANYYGIFDLSGNVEEWVADQYGPPNASNSRRAIGGSWSVGSSQCTVTSSTGTLDPSLTRNYTGFRVVTTWME
jgi:formylglycine-generating enzyme required for sulfatase activity